MHNLKFTKDHEWVKVEGSFATVGITHFAQDSLGDIVYTELNAYNTKVSKHSLDNECVFGIVEAVKTVSELYAPLSGTISEVNFDVINEPSLINNDPYGKGWMIKISLSDLAEVDDLLSYEEYQKLIGE